LEFNEAHQLLFYADDVNTLIENTNTTRKNTEALIETSWKAGLEVVNTEKTKYMFVLLPECRTKS
jgi:hypothetical protein